MTSGAADAVSALLAAIRAGEAPAVAIVVAHPDDETIGIGSLLPRLRRAHLLHVTDGAPRDLRDARAAGFESAADYARARRQELDAALALAGWEPARRAALDIPDQEASLDMGGLSHRIAGWLREIAPRYVITHAYEGGHPDHDATAFAVHGAIRRLWPDGEPAPAILEMALYNNPGGRMVVHDFLPAPDRPATTLRLGWSERRRKARMLKCFRSQRASVALFPVGVERLRPAPTYDFTRPPHDGPLHYDRQQWGMTGERWRGLAVGALASIDAGPKD